MSSENEKDVLQKIVEGMDISDDELDFHDVLDPKPTNINEKVSMEIVKSPGLPNLEEISDSGDPSLAEDIEKSKEKSDKDKSQSEVVKKPAFDDIVKEIFETSTDKIENEPSKISGNDNDTKDKNNEKEAIPKEVQEDKSKTKIEINKPTRASKRTIKDSESEKNKGTSKTNDEIVDEIFETDEDGEKGPTRKNKRSKKDSEVEKNNEEESIENIQTLLNTEDNTEAAKTSMEVKSECPDKIESAVFISMDPKDSSDLAEDEEQTQNPLASTHNPLETAQEIPQVMLDQLDLKKFPNLKINKEGTTSAKTSKTLENVTLKNMKLLAEIQKRMEIRKAQQRKSDAKDQETSEEVATSKRGKIKRNDDNVEEVASTEATPRSRGRPRKDLVQIKSTPKPNIQLKPISELKPSVELKPLSKKTPVVLKPLSKKTVELKPHSKKTIQPKIGKVSNVLDEFEDLESEEDVEIPLLSRPRSTRKIKMTDKFKSFVAQEKSIKNVLYERETSPIVAKKESSTPKPKAKSDIQIKLKRKKEASSEEEFEEVEEEEESDGAKSVTTRKRTQAKPSVPAKKAALPVKPEVKKTPVPAKSDVKKTPAPKKPALRKRLMSESELSEEFEDVDDEDKDPDFNDSDAMSTYSFGGDLIDTSLDQTREPSIRTVLELVQDVFRVMPTWNVHILPNTNSFCIAQIVRGVNGTPMLKKCIEMDLYFNVKVYVHQIHYKKYDGVYDCEEHLIELLQLVDAM